MPFGYFHVRPHTGDRGFPKQAQVSPLKDQDFMQY